MVERFSELRRETIQKTEGQVRDFLREEGYEDEFDDGEIEVLLGAIFKQVETYPDHREFWESERDRLITLAHNSASETFEELEQTTDRYLSTCESLQNNLSSRKTQLKRRYGIVSEFDPDEDLVTAV